jgi:DNA-binding NarL/FixJ family response regulator
MHEDGCISPTRVLLVEDHEPFRRFIRTALSNHNDLLVIAETGNGMDAVSKCLELRPGLVLMDIGLPGLNGIEAARRIRALVPNCRIVFLTQEVSSEIMQEAFSLGASSYVVKRHATNDLLPAITAAREGRQFASQLGAPRENVPSGAQSAKENPAGGAVSRQPGASDSHAVHFHPDEPSLCAGFADCIEKSLTAGLTVIAINTRAHRLAIQQMLQTRGIDFAAAKQAGRLLLLDVDETMAMFMVNDVVDPQRFFRAAGGVVKGAKAANPGLRVVACGEIAPTLWARGNRDAAIQVEQLWDELVRAHDLETLCCYRLTPSQRADGGTYQAICSSHTAVYSF